MTNVLVIIADELSMNGLGCQGGPAITPVLDALAAGGMRFTAAYTPSPICVPARASVATGRYVHQIGYWDSVHAYDGRVRGWGHRLQAAGRPVTSIGKLHYRRAGDPTGFDRQIEPIHIVDGIGWPQALLRRPVADYAATAEMAGMIGPGESDYTRFDRRVADAAAAWLAAPPPEPWCTFVSFLSPHFPLIAPEAHFRNYDPAEFESGPEPLPEHPILREIGAFFDHDRYFDERTRGIARAGYYALCSFLDRQVGRVLAALEASGQSDDTLVIMTADHGEMLGARGIWGKSVMYEASVRVPLIVSGPGISRGVRPDPVSLIDLAPTICGAMGVDVSGFPGHSLTAEPLSDRTVFSEYHDGGCSAGFTMVRWDRWKYVHYAEGHPAQLFDLAADPDERRDLAAACPEIAAEARARLAAEMDAEAVNARAHADQAATLAALGGRERVLAMEQWGFTPADSR